MNSGLANKISPSLEPLSYLYGLATNFRNSAYDKGFFKSKSSSLPVLGIGNITAGGNGKTPFAAYLAKELRKIGARPVILTRGYGGKIKGPHLASMVDTVSEVGDEALQHVTQLYPDVPVVVCADRVQGAKFIESKQLGDIVLLDDGFQHRRLKRDIDSVLLDASSEQVLDEWLVPKLLPAGHFREEPKRALERADVVILVSRGRSAVNYQLAELLKSKYSLKCPVLGISLKQGSLTNLRTGESYGCDKFKNLSVAMWTAIAKPESFRAVLLEEGMKVEKAMIFQDHYQFKQREWESFLALNSEPIFVTEKDAVKIRELGVGLDRVWVLALNVGFASKKDEGVFWDLLRAKLKLPAFTAKLGSAA